MSAGGDWGSGPLFLGFDLSTQSCKALLIDGDLNVVGSSRVHFDQDLAKYGTQDGCHRAEGGRVTSPTKMWVEAVELALDRLKEQGCPLDRVAAVSGSGQQHASVYWTPEGVSSLRGLDAARGSALGQLSAAFAAEDSPIWMDTSTTKGCKEMTELVGGALGLARLTGSAAQERFSGHHIRRFVAEHGLDKLGAVSLASSLGASLLRGDVVPVDKSDAAGMNLMDIRSQRWHEKLLEFVAPGQAEALRALLAEPQDPWALCGPLHPFWVERYGFSPQCSVAAWSGDNPCAVVGSGLVREGDICISLGTSDTVLSVIPAMPDAPLPFGHLFPHPILPGCYWSMLVYTNGDITRRKVRDDFFPEGDDGWEAFSKAVRETPPGNSGAVGIFFTTDEITPAVRKGDDYRARDMPALPSVLEYVTAFEDPRQNARAVIEMRALAVRNHLAKLMPKLLEPPAEGAEPPQLLVTGGASGNPAILQVYADVFQRPVRCMESAEGAAFGAAVRAMHASGEVQVADISARLTSSGEIRAKPNPAAASACAAAAERYAALEALSYGERWRD